MYSSFVSKVTWFGTEIFEQHREKRWMISFVISTYIQKCRKIHGLVAWIALERARVTQHSPCIFLHICSMLHLLYMEMMSTLDKSKIHPRLEIAVAASSLAFNNWRGEIFTFVNGEMWRVRKGGGEWESISSVLRRRGRWRRQWQKWRITPYCYCILFAWLRKQSREGQRGIGGEKNAFVTYRDMFIVRKGDNPPVPDEK